MPASSQSKTNTQYPSIAAVAGAATAASNTGSKSSKNGSGANQVTSSPANRMSPSAQTDEQGYLERALDRREETGIDQKEESTQSKH